MLPKLNNFIRDNFKEKGANVYESSLFRESDLDYSRDGKDFFSVHLKQY